MRRDASDDKNSYMNHQFIFEHESTASIGDGAGRLAGKRLLITAAGHGIGRASALACARQGARVTATDIDVAALDTLRQEAPGIEVHRLDVMDADAISSLCRCRGRRR